MASEYPILEELAVFSFDYLSNLFSIRKIRKYFIKNQIEIIKGKTGDLSFDFEEAELYYYDLATKKKFQVTMLKSNNDHKITQKELDDAWWVYRKHKRNRKHQEN